MKKLIAIILSLLPVLSFAQDVCKDISVLDWTPPVTRSDNTALPSNEIQGYQLYVSAVDGVLATGSVIAVVSLPSTITEFEHENPLPNCSSGDVDYAIATVDINNLVGEATDSIRVTMTGGFAPVEPLPSKPTLFSASVKQQDTEAEQCTVEITSSCKLDSFSVDLE
jgi:hypothetical protein